MKKKSDKVKVYIIESESGWGQKVDQTLEFDTIAKAKSYCKKYNRQHCPPMDQTPDWYMYARMEGQDDFGMIR